MATKYLQHFPKPVLDDLVTGRWLPIVGAGMSLNARVPSGKRSPLRQADDAILAGDFKNRPIDVNVVVAEKVVDGPDSASTPKRKVLTTRLSSVAHNGEFLCLQFSALQWLRIVAWE